MTNLKSIKADATEKLNELGVTDITTKSIKTFFSQYAINLVGDARSIEFWQNIIDSCEQVHQTETQASTVPATPTTPTAPTMIDLFCGGGCVTAGAIEAGFKPLLGIDRPPMFKDQRDLKNYNRVCDTYSYNFPDHPLIRKTVLDTFSTPPNYLISDMPATVDLIWASPSCLNFTQARSMTSLNESDRRNDLNAVEGIITALERFKPRYFILENVPQYQDSEVYKYLIKNLPSAYSHETHIIDFADYGVPQHRKRLILLAGLNGYIPSLPFSQEPPSWLELVEDLIPSLKPSRLIEAQRISLNNHINAHGRSDAYVVWRSPIHSRYEVRPSNRILNTITVNYFLNRPHFADLYINNNKCYQLNMEFIKRVTTLPDWYELPKSTTVAGRIMGNGVPSLFVAKLLNNLR